jgi:hypothetical protein
VNQVQVEIVCAERGKGLVEAFGDAVMVGVPAVRCERTRSA